MKRAFLLLLSLAACGRAPAPPRRMTNADCAACHVEVAKEHDASFHRLAFTDPTYQASLAREAPDKRASCNNCHAPDGEKDGVGCIACHGATPKSVKAVRSAPHALTVDPTFATERACATCHQAVIDGRPELAQRTLEEHAASDLASTPCQQCHMAERGPRRKHQFESGHSLAWLKGSVRVVAKRTAPDRVRVDLTAWAGHAFPTGDMFRRARLVVSGEDEGGAIVASEERVFGRTWGTDEHGLTKELSDTRVRGHFEEELLVKRIPMYEAPIARVRYVLLFERVLAKRGGDVEIVSSDPIAEGVAE